MQTREDKPNARQRRDAAILSHGLALKRIFPATSDIGPVTLYKMLRRLEAEAHRLAERECNEQLPEGYSEKKDASILRRLDSILGFKAAGIAVILNGDPRGYAIKIDDACMKAQGIELHRDMGGYGILAPEF
jgi:hypothetical protein